MAKTNKRRRSPTQNEPQYRYKNMRAALMPSQNRLLDTLVPSFHARLMYLRLTADSQSDPMNRTGDQAAPGIDAVRTFVQELLKALDNVDELSVTPTFTHNLNNKKKTAASKPGVGETDNESTGEGEEANSSECWDFVTEGTGFEEVANECKNEKGVRELLFVLMFSRDSGNKKVCLPALASSSFDATGPCVTVSQLVTTGVVWGDKYFRAADDQREVEDA